MWHESRLAELCLYYHVYIEFQNAMSLLASTGVMGSSDPWRGMMVVVTEAYLVYVLTKVHAKLHIYLR